MTVMMAGRDIQGAEVAPLELIRLVVMGARMEVMEITVLMVTLAGEDRARIRATSAPGVSRPAIVTVTSLFFSRLGSDDGLPLTGL